MTTLEIQRRLRALGHHPGPLDGVRGRRTIAALRAFQAARGLGADGIAGPATLAALSAGPIDGESAPTGGARWVRPPWMEEAERLRGLREAAGDADNPAILDWAKRLRIGFRHDSVAWCGLFAVHCIAFSLPDEALPTNPLGARNWLRFGRATEPLPGCVLVFWRGSPGGWQGHVGFHAGEDSAAFHVLGGNQSDSVSVARIARGRLLGARWPSTAPPPVTSVFHSEAGGALSTNEA